MESINYLFQGRQVSDLSLWCSIHAHTMTVLYFPTGNPSCRGAPGAPRSAARLCLGRDGGVLNKERSRQLDLHASESPPRVSRVTPLVYHQCYLFSVASLRLLYLSSLMHTNPAVPFKSAFEKITDPYMTKFTNLSAS